MIRFSFVLMLIACVGMFTGIALAQDDAGAGGGTVRGQIVDTTTAQNPIPEVDVRIVATGGEEFTATTDGNGDYEKSGIPAGRYLISIYREGYGDRVGKAVTVVNGGDHKGQYRHLLPEVRIRLLAACPLLYHGINLHY